MSDKDTWFPAMTKEIGNLEKRGCWTLVDRPTDAKVLDGMWVFDVKLDGDSVIIKPKARYVLRGDMQIAGQAPLMRCVRHLFPRRGTLAVGSAFLA